MAADKYLKFRGELQAIAGLGTHVAFVTVHKEGQATALYRLDADKLELSAHPLPGGGVDLIADDDRIYIAGTDGQVHTAPRAGGATSPLGKALSPAPKALALLGGERLGVVHGATVSVLSRKDGAVLQSFELPEDGACIGAEATGTWFAVGCVRGTVCVFEAEDKAAFVAAERGKLHEGVVTAIAFEREENRFMSLGADQRLLSTHARGKLEPEDRGKGGNHDSRPTALLVADERFYTGGMDSVVKCWPSGRSGRPTTTRDGISQVVGLALVTRGTRAHLAIAGLDNTVRLFILDGAGKLGPHEVTCRDAYSLAAVEFGTDDVKRREAALRDLASYNDAPAIETLGRQALQDGDHRLRKLATELLGGTGNPRAIAQLDSLLRAPDEAVRLAAFAGLRGLEGESNLEVLEKALQVGQKDVGMAAIRALEPLARGEELAFDKLVSGLDRQPFETRKEALAVLEAILDATSAEASIRGLKSGHADVRRLALIRLYQRQMLGRPEVRSAVRRAAEDGDGDVRRAAFLISVLERPALTEALRARDKDLHRGLYELEHWGKELGDGELPKTRKKKLELESDDYRPLLEAMASGNLDTCLSGVSGLASLGDPRAFGILLQLTREADETARVYVCRALEQLGDPQSIERLETMLRDGAASVRDAAFTALNKIHDGAPMSAARAGLTAAHEDVRRRGLQVLSRELKRSLPKDMEAPGIQLLVRALNDTFPAVRNEAFKTALNLQVDGGGESTQRFILRSVHADVRREVLNEVMGRMNEAWARPLLFDLFSDPEPKLRADAFTFAVDKAKGDALQVLEAGLTSGYADIRLSATQWLVKKHTKASRTMLESALDDDDARVRNTAIDALVVANAEEALDRALESARPDVRAKAAAARARYGDRKALAPLLAIIAEVEPDEKEARAQWTSRVMDALEGVGALGDAEAVETVRPLLQHKDAALRAKAARALGWSVSADQLGVLDGALHHADAAVRHIAALGLAYAARSIASSLVFSDEGSRHLTERERVDAAVALGAEGEGALVAFLDHSDEGVRDKALLLLMLREYAENDGVPDRCLAGLASAHHRVRLMSALALEAFPDPEAFLAFLVTLINDRADKDAWKIERKAVETLAVAISHGTPRLRARASATLDALAEEKQRGFDLAFSLFERRFDAEARAEQPESFFHKVSRWLGLFGEDRTADLEGRVESRYSPAEVREIVFGAYVGLARNQDRTSSTWANARINPVRVRQTALRRLAAIAIDDRAYVDPACAVFVQSLRDGVGEVRLQAFEHLKAAGVAVELLGGEALAAGYNDVGVRGLEELSGGGSSEEGNAILRQVMMTNTDGLETEAARLLKERLGLAAAVTGGLEAASQNMRLTAVNWLSYEPVESVEANELLRGALKSRFKQVRFQAASTLSYRNDKSCFDVLVEKLGSDGYYEQYDAIWALSRLNDPRTAGVLLDRLEHDERGNANLYVLMQQVGQTRDRAVVDRLLGYLHKTNWRSETIGALKTISGFDQYIEDEEDERADRTWETRQQPRHTDVLARLIDKLLEVGDLSSLRWLLSSAQWARGAEVDPVLEALTGNPDDGIRHEAVQAFAWRARKRGAKVEVLRRALEHTDPDTRFYAAEGLARAGAADGLNVLQTSVEMLDDFGLRVRAVAALGELADPRALDLLLRLANETDHALQEAAAEAIGHMGKTDKAAEIFTLLERLARGDDGVASSALAGLRWFGTREAWQIIRDRAVDPDCWFNTDAIALLSHNDDPATRDLLSRLITTNDDWSIVQAAHEALREVCGADSLEPDYALLQSEHPDIDDDALGRVITRGDSDRILGILPKVQEEEPRNKLQASLLSRGTSTEAAASALDSQHPIVVETAARLLGRLGAGCASHEAALLGRFEALMALWSEQRALKTQGRPAGDLDALASALRWIVWALGRGGVGLEARMTALGLREDDAEWRPVRLSALQSITDGALGAAELPALDKIAVGADPELRAIAISALAAGAPANAARLSAELLGDATSLGRIVRRGVDVAAGLRGAAGAVHYQGVVLPHLVAAGQLDGLGAAASDAAASEVSRLGAIEALGRLGTVAAEDALATLGKDEKLDLELRKAAWRAFRRCRRLRNKVQTRDAATV